MAFTQNYFTAPELALRNLLYDGDLYEAQQFVRTEYANIILEQPLRMPQQLAALNSLYGVNYMNTSINYKQFIHDTCYPIEEIDALVEKEIKRRSSLNWRIILFISKLKARRPKQRFIYFENMYIQTSTHAHPIYAITCSTRQGLIEQIFRRNILHTSEHMYVALLDAQMNSLPIGSRPRKTLQGNFIPKDWHSVYIRFIVRNDELSNGLNGLTL